MDWREQQTNEMNIRASDEPEVQRQSPRQQELDKSTQDWTLPPGTIIDSRYEIESFIGKGGYGKVYKARQLLLGKPVALKVLNRIAANEATVRRFRNEAKVAVALEHPNLARALDFGVLGDQPFILMEYLEGETLAQLIKRRGKLPLGEATPIFLALCSGMEYAHEHGIVHRDLKPSNVILARQTSDPDNVIAKILDFGIAKIEMENLDQTLTKTGEIFGTPLYMSPEQCIGAKVDARSDIYSLGCILFEMLTGTPPFAGSSAIRTMMLHGSARPPTLKEASLGDTFPEPLEHAIQRVLAKDPEKRFQTCGELAIDVTDVQRAQTAIRPNSKTQHRKLRTRVKTTLGALFIIMVCASALAIGVTISDGGRSPKTAQAPDIPRNEGVSFVPPPMGYEFYIQSNPNTHSRVCSIPNPGTGATIIVTNDLIHGLGKKLNADGKPHQISPDEFVILSISFNDILNNPSVLAHFRNGDLSGFVVTSNGMSVLEPELGAVHQYPNEFMVYLRHLNALKKLDLHDSAVGLQGFKNADIDSFHNLEFLGVPKGFDGKDLVTFKVLKNLKCLDIGETRNASSVVSIIPNCPNLITFGGKNDNLTNRDLESISKCPSLTYVTLSGNKAITGDGLKHLVKLKNLELLFIADCSIKPEDLEPLLTLPKLSYVVINMGGWTESERNKWIERFGKHKCNLKSIEKHKQWDAPD